MEKKKKSILILLIALLCFVAVGCGNNNSNNDDSDEKESKSEKKKDKEKEEKESNEKTISCTMEEDEGKVIVSFTQNQKTYEFTSGKMSMSIDVNGAGFEDLTASDFESMFCNSDADVPYTDCKANLSEGVLTVEYDVDVKKFINEEYEVEELNEDTLQELKSEFEKEDYTCKIS